MTHAAEALSAAQQREYAARGRADLDQRLVRLSRAERDAFWRAVRGAYVARAADPAPSTTRAASRRRDPVPLLQEAC